MNRQDGGGACSFWVRSGIVPSTLSIFDLGVDRSASMVLIPNSNTVVIETRSDMTDDGDTLIAFQ